VRLNTFKWVGELFGVRSFRCPSFCIPVGYLGDFLDALLIRITIFFGQTKLVGMLTQPYNDSLLDGFATPQLGIRSIASQALIAAASFGEK
jgi:hypothetical protein